MIPSFSTNSTTALTTRTTYLELRNVSAVDLPLDAWQLSILTRRGNVVIPFPAGTVIPVGEVLLLVNTAPADTGDSVVSSVIDETFALPQAEFALILRGPSTIGDLAGNYLEERNSTLGDDAHLDGRYRLASASACCLWLSC